VARPIETEEIPAYAAVAMAGLGWLPDTIIKQAKQAKHKKRQTRLTNG
jgi:hypothetical protein